MTLREGVLLFLTTAATFVAALTYRVATSPGRIHDPVHAQRFEEACRILPVLGALRVRSPEPDAGRRLARASLDVVDPARAAATYRWGRLLFATPAEIADVKDRLRRGDPPVRLPPAPDPGVYFRDAQGPYSCDVLGGEVERVRAVLPRALLSGEPVARAAEERTTTDVTRAMVVGVVLACAWSAIRRKGVDAEHRLFAAVLPLAILGIADWGVDAWTVPALVLSAAAPRGLPLLSAAPCLFFPSLALRRIGVVLVVGGLVRWGAAARGPVPGLGRPLLLSLALAGAGAAASELLLPPSRVPDEVRHEAAVAFVPREERTEPMFPPKPDLPTRRDLRDIHSLATELALRAAPGQRDQWIEVAEAAAVESLYIPRDLRRRLRTEDGRSALWMPGANPVADPAFTSATIYRLRGQEAMRRDAVRAAWSCFFLAAAALSVARGRAAAGPVLARFVGVALAFVVLQTAHRAGQPLAAEVCLPVAVAASFGVAWLLVPGLLAGALFLPGVFLHVAVALLAATAFGFIRR